MIEDNLASMAEIARANGIRVVLASVLPVDDYPWRRGLEPAPKILALDNQAATIFVGESIRYARSTAASNQNGGLTFSVEEDQNSPVNVGFQLLAMVQLALLLFFSSLSAASPSS